MTTARWITATLSFCSIWCLGALVLLPRMEEKLTQAARTALDSQRTLQHRLSGLHIAFEGQIAHLSGKVRTAQDQLVIRTTIENLVRAPTLIASGLGERLNPVIAVQNDVEVSPYPPGWIILAANGPKAQLLGTVATDLEARDLTRSISESWIAKGGSTKGSLQANLDIHDDATGVRTTLDTLPSPLGVAIHLARLGGSWQTLPFTASDEELHTRAEAFGITDAEWAAQVLPVVKELRIQHLTAAKQTQEATRVSMLPPGHLFIAVRDQRITLRGEVGTAAIKRALIDEALSTFPSYRIHDDIRISSSRRPAAEFAPLTLALLPREDATEQKSFSLGISGHAWQALDWRGGRTDKIWRQPLPALLEDSHLSDDSAQLIDWLQGAKANLPTTPSQPAVIALALFGNKAILSGQLAEQALHAQLLSAVRQTYAPGITITADAFMIRGNCQPANEILHTSRSLPPIGPRPILALATPGSTWTIIPITAALLEPGALSKTPLVPDTISGTLIEDLAAESLDQLRQHLQAQIK